jgi:4-diphosphocytidyl-2-C-methyl-D-erythritol kinase
MTLEKRSPCKVNLLLNILGRRADGFHELESVLHPVPVCDRLTFARAGASLEFACSDPALPADGRNLVHRAAAAFLEAANLGAGVRVYLEKHIPLAAGLGGGSGNAATTLLGLNELFGGPLDPARLQELAAGLGSDVAFFLQARPALATGRGEKIEPLDFFPALRGKAWVLIYPGFGIATAWAYQQLAKFPGTLHGQPGRARQLVSLLRTSEARTAGAAFYNALEVPALRKHPVLALYQEFLRAQGALATLMSGSGSTTFAVVESVASGAALVERFKGRFGTACWTAVVPV